MFDDRGKKHARAILAVLAATLLFIAPKPAYSEFILFKSGEVVHGIPSGRTAETTFISLDGGSVREFYTNTIERIFSDPPAPPVLNKSVTYAEEPEPTLVVQDGHTDDVLALEYSDDGRFLASAGRDETVRIWNTATGELLRMFDAGGPVYSMSLNGDGALAAWGVASIVRVADVETGEITATLRGHTGLVECVAFSQNRGQIATAGRDNTIRLWDPDGGDATAVLDRHLGWVVSLAFSPSGGMLASGSRDKSIKLWDTASGKLVRTLEGHTGSVEALAFSPDGKTLASGGWDKTIKLWDVKTGEPLRTIPGLSDGITALAFSPRGDILLSGGNDRSVRLWNPETGLPVRNPDAHPGRVEALAFAPGGAIFAEAGEGEDIIFRDTETGLVKSRISPHAKRIESVSISPDGKTLAAASGDRTVKVWDLTTGVLQGVLGPHFEEVDDAPISPDGAFIASAGEDSDLRLWDTRTGALMRLLRGNNTYPLETAAVTGGGSPATAGSWDGKVIVWDSNDSNPPASSRAHRGAVRAADISPDGKLAATGGADGVLIIWEAATGKEKMVFDTTSSINAVRFSPDGKMLAWGEFDTIKLITLSGGKPAPLEGHFDNVDALAFSPDGKLLASTGRDGTLRLWDTSSKKQIYSRRAHRGAATGVSFSPDGKIIATGGHDGAVRIWNAEKGAQLAELTAFDNGIWIVTDAAGRYDCSGRGKFETELDCAPALRWSVGFTQFPAIDYVAGHLSPGLLANVYRQGFVSELKKKKK